MGVDHASGEGWQDDLSRGMPCSKTCQGIDAGMGFVLRCVREI